MTNNIPSQLRNILQNDKSERSIAPFLKEHPDLLYWTFCKTGGHRNYVLHEFPLGNQHKADFVVLHSYSGTWEVHFIELEPIRDAVFTKDRRPSKKLSIAIRQIDDWRLYIDLNKAALKQDLVRWAKKRDILDTPKPDKEPCNYAGDYLSDPSSFVGFHYYIIIGMRADLTKEKRELKSRFRNDHRIHIGSYDRFIDTADVRYKKR